LPGGPSHWGRHRLEDESVSKAPRFPDQRFPGASAAGNYYSLMPSILARIGYNGRMHFGRPLEALTPTLDGDVLSVLARADAEMTGREIQRLAGHGSHQGIRNAADRLAEQGVVLRRPAGSANLYKLNRDHVAAPWIEGLAALPEQVLERLRSAIGAWTQPPTLAVLFGSVATGLSTPASDLDLLIVRPAGCDPDEPTWREQISSLEEQATAWTGNDARIIEYDEEDLAGDETEPLLRDALRDGIELHGSLRTLRRLTRAGSAQ
jgi:predicted nucleotidyltransferase